MGVVSGIYEIRNVLNNHRYIGSSVNIEKRWRDHVNLLKSERGHHSIHLQRAWDKYGDKHFEFKVLEECEPIKETLLLLEQKYLDLKPEYNIATIAGRPKDMSGENNPRYGIPCPIKVRYAVAQANKRREWTDQQRNLASNRAKGSEWNNSQKKIVCMLNKETGVVEKEFTSISSAAKWTGHINHRVSIKRCCQGKYLSAYGYVWKFKEQV